MANRKHWILIILVMFIFYGSSSVKANMFSLTNDADYKIYFERYAIKNEETRTDILIEYPQIKNMKSQEIETKVNKLLKEKAISVLQGERIKGLSLPMKTKVEYFNSDIISVKYTGYGYYFDAIHGDNIMYATNINLKTGEIIDIRNLFTDGFQQKLNRNIFKLEKANERNAANPNTYAYLYVHADESIISELFKKYYDRNYNNKAIGDGYYFSEKYFNIIVLIPSSPAYYLELAASYDDLKNCMNYNDRFWNDILKLKEV